MFILCALLLNGVGGGDIGVGGGEPGTDKLSVRSENESDLIELDREPFFNLLELLDVVILSGLVGAKIKI